MYPFRAKFDPSLFFVTSDLHCQHKNMCRGVSAWSEGYRDFDTTEAMTNLVIDNINATVPEEGFLFNLGDSLFGDKKNARAIRHRIKCRNIFYLYGNHCEWLRKDEKLQKELYNWCGDYLEVFAGRQLVCMHHYAPRVWNESHRGSWHTYGHSHGSLHDLEDAKCIDVGVDCQYIDYNGRLIMTTNFDKSPTEKNGYLNYSEKLPLCRKVLHKRFTPFTFNELSKIMSYKTQAAVDHHNRRDMQ